MKKIFLYILVTFIIIVCMTLLLFFDKDDNNDLKEKLNTLNNIDRKINYFKYRYIDRYILYKQKYPYLNDIDIVTRVNLNLDYPFYTHTSLSKRLNKIDILVNKYIYLPEDYVPNNLVNIDKNIKLVKEAKDNFELMKEAAKKENLNIRIVSGYRSYDYQNNLYNKYLLEDNKENVDSYSARPGFSEHQTGLVIDIDNIKLGYEQFSSTDEYNWMQDNAYKYGYILRYPEDKEYITGYLFEGWHYRYVGKKIATYIHKHNITFDEYYVRFIDK